jgi:hypothetical protein
MIYISEEQVIGVDVDDTLVLHRAAKEGETTVDVLDPYDGTTVRLVVHKPHIKLIEDRTARGCAIIVWSQSGPQWAKAVVDALGIKPALICAKPFFVVDDLPINEWLNNRVYLNPEMSYGSGQLIVNDVILK